MSKSESIPTAATQSAQDVLSNVSSSDTTHILLSPMHLKHRKIRAPSVQQVAKRNLPAESIKHNASTTKIGPRSSRIARADQQIYDTLVTLTDENIPPKRTSHVDSGFRSQDSNVEDVPLENRPDIAAQRQLEKHLLNTLLDAEHEASTLKDLLSQSRANEACLFSLLAQSQQNTAYLEAQLGAAHTALSAYEHISVTSASPDYFYASFYPPASSPEDAEHEADILSPADTAYTIPRTHSFGDLKMYTSNDW
ncbi:hypothetical protein BDZ89DRAFT_1155186 [Hymenopellis radicata]|nr:hypothetical protein BDZ89DRAFT_1155186 [Hymenopellis radicata]